MSEFESRKLPPIDSGMITKRMGWSFAMSQGLGGGADPGTPTSPLTPWLTEGVKCEIFQGASGHTAFSLMVIGKVAKSQERSADSRKRWVW